MPTPRTAESIWKEASARSTTALGERRLINHLFRLQDDSHLWPTLSRFNVTERAIRRARHFERMSDVMSGLEYALFLEMEICRIVNEERCVWNK